MYPRKIHGSGHKRIGRTLALARGSMSLSKTSKKHSPDTKLTLLYEGGAKYLFSQLMTHKLLTVSALIPLTIAKVQKW